MSANSLNSDMKLIVILPRCSSGLTGARATRCSTDDQIRYAESYAVMLAGRCMPTISATKQCGNFCCQTTREIAAGRRAVKSACSFDEVLAPVGRIQAIDTDSAAGWTVHGRSARRRR